MCVSLRGSFEVIFLNGNIEVFSFVDCLYKRTLALDSVQKRIILFRICHQSKNYVWYRMKIYNLYGDKIIIILENFTFQKLRLDDGSNVFSNQLRNLLYCYWSYWSCSLVSDPFSSFHPVPNSIPFLFDFKWWN